MMSEVARLEKLKVYFYDQKDKRFIRAVEDASLEVKEGSVLGLVGESGCGKTVTALSIMGLVQSEPGMIGGKFFFRPKARDFQLLERDIARVNEKDGRHRKDGMLNIFHGLNSYVKFKYHPFTIIKDSEKWLRHMDRVMEHIRGKNISMVFQNPLASLNPFISVGKQLERTVGRFHSNFTRNEIRDFSVELLHSVRLYNPRDVMGMYPRSLSIGMAQRIVIAIALASSPKLLIADEPTTGLDTSNRQKVIDLLKFLVSDMNLNLFFISHNIRIVGLLAGEIAVMYAGIILEKGSNSEVIQKRKAPRHPYTEALLSAIPTDEDIKKGKRLRVIYGSVPNNKIGMKGCPFLPRCFYAVGNLRERCESICPPLFQVSPGHFIRCYLFEK